MIVLNDNREEREGCKEKKIWEFVRSNFEIELIEEPIRSWLKSSCN